MLLLVNLLERLGARRGRSMSGIPDAARSEAHTGREARRGGRACLARAAPG